MTTAYQVGKLRIEATYPVGNALKKLERAGKPVLITVSAHEYPSDPQPIGTIQKLGKHRYIIVEGRGIGSEWAQIKGAALTLAGC
jgi:hypothetical protein